MSLAFVFPGQGSQSVGMMQPFAEEAVVRATFAEASSALDQDLWSLAQDGPSEQQALTVNTQPLMLAADIALFRLWRERGGAMPSVVAGHSLGEYAALVAAEVMDFSDAMRLVRRRAQAMQAATPEGSGAIAAVLGLDDAQVIEACRAAAQGDVVEPANFNTPGQVVIAGAKTAVERALELAKEKGAKRAVMLPMSIPAHCALMRPAAQQLRAGLDQLALRLPGARLLQNATLAHPESVAALRDALIDQLHNPVRWVETIQAMQQSGVQSIVECGPGRVLVGLNKRIAASLQHYSLHDAVALQQALTAAAA